MLDETRKRIALVGPMLLLLVILCMSLTSCSEETSLQTTAPELQGDDISKARGGSSRPFLGTWETTFTPAGEGVPGCDGDEATGIFIIEGVGNARHLARIIHEGATADG